MITSYTSENKTEKNFFRFLGGIQNSFLRVLRYVSSVQCITAADLLAPSSVSCFYKDEMLHRCIPLLFTL